jgi:hypothetical protein
MGLLQTQNFLTDLSAYGCADPGITIWAATFIPAVAPAIVEFVSFGCRDIIKFRAGVGAPCGRMIKADVKKALTPKLFKAAGNMMKFDRVASEGGFWFMIIDLASDSIMRWNTLAYRYADCPIAGEQASWGYEPFFEDVLFAGVPKPLAGRIVDYQGEFGHATITGAVCPTSWHFQANFSTDWRPFPGHPPGNVTLWIQASGNGNYDFPGKQFGWDHYGWQNGEGAYGLKNQAHGTRSTAYTMYALAEQQTIISGAYGNMSVSKLDPMNVYLSPLNCWRGTENPDVPDPAGRNRKKKPANMLSPIFNPVTPKPVRGRPGGMPRSKK